MSLLDELKAAKNPGFSATLTEDQLDRVIRALEAGDAMHEDLCFAHQTCDIGLESECLEMWKEATK